MKSKHFEALSYRIHTFQGLTITNEIKIKRTSDFSRFFPTFTEVCFPFEDPGRSLLVVGPRFRLAVSSALSPTLALSDKSVSPFTLVTAKEKNYTENSRGSFTLISALTNRSR